jgi:hypothetical protein
MIGVDSKLV